MARMAHFVTFFLTCFVFGGCSSFKLAKDNPAADAAQAMTQYPPVPMVAVELHSAGGKVKVEEIPLEDGMTVGDALEKLKANRRFRRAIVDIQRTHNGVTHKMPVDFNNGNHRVSHSTNYALHPKDRVLVKEDSGTVIDDLMQKLTGVSPKRSR